MKQEDVDKIYDMTKQASIMADLVIEELDILRKQKNNFIFPLISSITNERVAGMLPSSTQEDFSEYLGKLRIVCRHINECIDYLRKINILLADAFNFINLKIDSNKELTFMQTNLKSRLFAIRRMIDEIVDWIDKLTNTKELRISDDPIKHKNMTIEMIQIHDMMIKFLNDIGLKDLIIIKNLNALYEKMEKEGYLK